MATNKETREHPNHAAVLSILKDARGSLRAIGYELDTVVVVSSQAVRLDKTKSSDPNPTPATTVRILDPNGCAAGESLPPQLSFTPPSPSTTLLSPLTVRAVNPTDTTIASSVASIATPPHLATTTTAATTTAATATAATTATTAAAPVASFDGDSAGEDTVTDEETHLMLARIANRDATATTRSTSSKLTPTAPIQDTTYVGRQTHVDAYAPNSRQNTRGVRKRRPRNSDRKKGRRTSS